jgi:hypothetical protein
MLRSSLVALRSSGPTSTPRRSKWSRSLRCNNLSCELERIDLDTDVAIVRISDEDRDELLTTFGDWFGPQRCRLLWWTHAIRTRYEVPTTGPISAEPAIAAIRDVVSALRLARPGSVGTTIVWERSDPPGAIVTQAVAGQSLFAPHGVGIYVNPPAHSLTADDAAPLRQLLGALRAATGDRRFALALRRFDLTFERLEAEDRLIDRWIAFEALLVPEGGSDAIMLGLTPAEARCRMETVVEFAEPLSASEPAEWPGYCQGERPPRRLGLYVPGT